MLGCNNSARDMLINLAVVCVTQHTVFLSQHRHCIYAIYVDLMEFSLAPTILNCIIQSYSENEPK